MDQAHAGQRIRRLRERKAWTQEHLATAAGVSTRTVQRAEDGVMSAETLTAIAGALDEPVEALTAKPSSYPRLMPVLYYDDPESVAWVERVFGFEPRMKYAGPDGKIVHAELVLDDAVVMVGAPMSEEGWSTPKLLGGPMTQSLYVMVSDVDTHFARVRDAGATILSEPADAHGQRRYRVADPEGHQWWFASET